MKVGLSEVSYENRKNTLAENIVVCIAVSLAGTFYFCEYFYGETIHTAVCLILTAAIAVTWLICSLCSGRDGRLGFMIFAFLYLGIPYIYILWYGTRDNLHDYNKWLAMSNKIAKAILCDPFGEAAQKTGSSPETLAAVLLISVMAAYIAGILITIAKSAKTAAGRGETADDDGKEA